MSCPATGGWYLSADHVRPGFRCLVQEEPDIDVAHNDNPLNPDQMRALADQLRDEADEMDARFEGSA
jgi:hypothetical protein